MKTIKIIYYISTGLLTLLMLFSASMYLFKYTEVQQAFTTLGYPTYIIYPLASLKLLGIYAIWFTKNKIIKEWAYAGFFFNFALAFFAHFMVGDGEQTGALMALVLLITSYITTKKIQNG